ncbi:hypothetical protein QL285_005110 [Trifolium repens]|nr:hypothetical protein QL285_005110 [Trifolium repens]
MRYQTLACAMLGLSVRETGIKQGKSIKVKLQPFAKVTRFWKENWPLELKGKWIQARNKGGNTPTLLDNEIFYASSCNLSFNHDLLDP